MDLVEGQEIAEVIGRRGVGGIGHDDGEDAIFESQRHDLVNVCHGLGNDGQGLGTRLGFGEVG